ncbi:hypothetical protein CRG98_045400, partial [Punica granatum]
VCSPVRVYFSASHVRRDCSLVPHTILPGLHTRASLLFFFVSSSNLLACASCNLAWPAHPSEFTFLLRRYAKPARLCLIQSCRVSSPVRVYFFCFASSPSLLACASYNLAGSAHPCEFIFFASQVRRACSLVPHTILPGQLTRASLFFLLRKFAEPARLCLIQSCRVSSPVRVYFFCFASSPSLLACASYNLAGSAHPCEFIFFASQVRRACSLVPHTILPGLHTRASLLFFFVSSSNLLACASCNLAWPAYPCEFTFLLRRYAEHAHLCLIQSCRVCSPVRVYFSASQVRRAFSLVPLATLPGLLTRASLLFCFPSSVSLLARASCNLAWPAYPCEFTFLLPKFGESARSCLLQPCLACLPVRVYFSASQVRRACSLVPQTILPGLHTRASLLFCFASSPNLFARASCTPSLLASASYNLAGSAHPCEFTFLLRKFAEPARLCLIQSCQVCTPVRVYFSASQVRRAGSLVPHTILPGLHTRASLLFCFAGTPSLLASASYNLAGSAHPCEFTFLLPKFGESARSCLLQACLVCSPVRVYFSAVQVRRAF